MKVIDLLNKIANGEDVPKVIVYENKIYHYVEEYKDYEFDDGGYCLFSDEFEKHYGITSYLNDEVEILDEPKEDKIEKVDTYVLCDSDFHTRYKDGYSLKATEIITKAFEEYSYKINEIIDKLNKEE